MSAGIVLSDILASDAAAAPALSPISVFSRQNSITSITQIYTAGRRGFKSPESFLSVTDLHSQVLHKFIIHISKTDNQLFINTVIMSDPVTVQFNLLGTGGK